MACDFKILKWSNKLKKILIQKANGDKNGDKMTQKFQKPKMAEKL